MNNLEMTMDELLITLPEFQREIMSELLKENSIEKTLDIWLSSCGPDNTASFGGSSREQYLNSFKNEFNKFICKYPEYQKYNEELEKSGKITSFLLVSCISTALSDTLGVAANVVAPLIVLLLGLIGRIGLNAYISNVKDSIE